MGPTLSRFSSSGREGTFDDDPGAPVDEPEAVGTDAGMEKPTTEEVGSLDFDEEAVASAGCCRRDAHDFFTAGFGGAGAGTVAGTAASEAATVASTAGTCSVVATDASPFETSGATFASDVSSGLDAGEGAVRDTDVFVDNGEPGTGVSGAVEQTDVVSVADEDRASARSDSGEGTSLISSCDGVGSTRTSGTKATAFGFTRGEAAGLGRLSAFCTI